MTTTFSCLKKCICALQQNVTEDKTDIKQVWFTITFPICWRFKIFWNYLEFFVDVYPTKQHLPMMFRRHTNSVKQKTKHFPKIRYPTIWYPSTKLRFWSKENTYLLQCNDKYQVVVKCEMVLSASLFNSI